MYEKNPIDSRTLSQIWEGLSKYERHYLFDEMKKKGLPRQSFYRWLRGANTPQPNNMVNLVSIFGKMGIRTSAKLLFPEA